MTEEHAEYKVGGQPKVSPGALKKFTDPGYRPPTAEDVRALKAISGLTGKELCALAGVEDHRTWRRWSQDPEQAGARQIPYSTWRLLLLELGLISGKKEKGAG